MIWDAKDCRELCHDLLALHQTEKCNLQSQELKGFVHQNPAGAQPVLLGGCEGLDHTGSISAALEEEFMLACNAGVWSCSILHRMLLEGLLPPKFGTILQFSA